ncbi:MAG: GNAT family N-acetyltransferase [Chloroflexota bacterium]|nr:GNAT family N-acetyltransferase [Chloroflexota bacterium]
MRQGGARIGIRQMRSSDLQSVLPLAREASCRPRLDVEWLRYHTVDDSTCPPDLRLVAQRDQEVVGFCFGCLRGGRGVIKLFGVAAPHRRAGIASALFEEMESRFRKHGISEVTVGGVAPNYFCPGVPVHNTAAVSFLLQQGYETDRKTRVDMVVDLQAADLSTADAERELEAAGILLRRASEDEIEGVAAFAQQHFSREWAVEVEASRRFHPPPLFVASKQGRYIAFAAYDVTGECRFGPTGTQPRYRRRGIGSTLLKKCLQSMRARGDESDTLSDRTVIDTQSIKTAEIGWVGPIDYYARVVGARINRAYWIFHKTLNKVS